MTSSAKDSSAPTSMAVPKIRDWTWPPASPCSQSTRNRTNGTNAARSMSVPRPPRMTCGLNIRYERTIAVPLRTYLGGPAGALAYGVEAKLPHESQPFVAGGVVLLTDLGALAQCRFSEQRQRDRHDAAPEGSPPSPDHPAGDDDGGGQEAAASVDPPGVARAQHGAAIAVGDQVLVERGQEIRIGKRRRGDARRLARAPVRDAGDRLRLQLGHDRGQAGARVGGRQPGPPGEVGDGGGTAAAKIAPRGLAECGRSGRHEAASRRHSVVHCA